MTLYDHDVSLAKQSYGISLHDDYHDPDGTLTTLPSDSYLIRSEGTIARTNSKDIEHRVSAIVSKLRPLDTRAALCIFDGSDLEKELHKFESNQWKINGKDHDMSGLVINGGGGLPAIAVANDAEEPPLDSQCGARIDQVIGWLNAIKTRQIVSVASPQRPVKLPGEKV